MSAETISEVMSNNYISADDAFAVETTMMSFIAFAICRSVMHKSAVHTIEFTYWAAEY